MKCIILLSGGPDSASAMRLMQARGHEVYPIFVDYGQAAVAPELHAATQICSRFGLPLRIGKDSTYSHLLHPLLSREKTQFDADGATSPYYLPGRNIMLGLHGLAYATEIGASKVVFGFIRRHSFKEFPDTSPEFLREMTGVFSRYGGNSEIECVAPIHSEDKAGVMRLTSELGIPITTTYSCYYSKECGECPSCLERKKGIAAAQSFDAERKF